jgi:uncharacterized protein
MNEQINTQVVQTAYDCFGKGDVAGIVNELTTDVIWHVAPVNNVPYTGTHNGHTGAAEFFTLMAEAEDTLKFEPQEFIAQGDKVVVIGHYEGRVKSTGREYETYFVHVFTLRNSKITSFVEYTDTAAITNAFVKAQTA